MFSLRDCFPPSSLATAKARYSSQRHNPLPSEPTGISPSMSGLFRPLRPGRKRTAYAFNITLHLRQITLPDSVWTLPFSLAANQGISIDFSSSSYSDVSFRRVRVPRREHRDTFRHPSRKSHSGILGSKAACAYPRLIAACHALHSPSSQAIHQVASARRMTNP